MVGGGDRVRVASHDGVVPPTASRVLVGRGRERAQLTEVGLLAAAGDPQIVVVRGEAGIGKTSLVREWVSDLRAKHRETVVAVGHGVPLSGGAIPYGLVSDLLGDLVEVVGSEQARDAVGPGARALGPIVPALVDASSIEPVDRLQLFGVSQELLRTLSTARLVVLVVEDLHWADEPSVELVDYWARTVSRGKLVLVVTSRDHGESEDTLASLGNLERLPDATSLALKALGDADVANQIEQLAPSCTPTELARIRAMSGGVPLYVEELVAVDGEGLPPTLRAALGRRLSLVDEPARGVLQAAALEPRPFEVDVLAAVVGAESGQVYNAVDQGVSRGLLESAGGGRWRFHHELLREAVANTMSSAAARDVHQGWAEQLSHADDAALDDWVAAAEHRLAVGRSRAALDALTCAASFAAVRGHSASVSSLLRRALDLDYAGPPLATPDERDELLAGYFATLPTLTESASVIAAEQQRPELASEVRQVWLELEAGIVAGSMTSADVVRLRTTLMAHATEDLAAMALDKLMRVHIGVGDDVDELRKTLDCVLEVVELRGGNVTVERAEWLSFIDRDLTCAGHYAMWLEALDSCTTTWDRQKAIARVIHSLVGLGRFELAQPRFNEFFALAPGPETSKWWYIVARLAAESNELQGRWDEAERFYRAIADPRGFDDGLRLGWAGLALLAAHRGDWARLDEVRAEIASLAPAPGRGVIGYRERYVPDIVRAHIVADDDAAQARAELDPAIRVAATGEEVRPLEATLLLAAQLAAREPASEPEFAELTLRAVRAQLNDGPLENAWSTEIEAHLVSAQGEANSADWEKVVAGWDELAIPFRAAESRLTLAECLIREGARTAARETLNRALEQAAPLGAQPLTQAIRALAVRAHIRLLDHDATPTTGPLTPRETEVLQLLATGATNEHIASTLFMSRRTASVHVSHILSKLNATNRTEAVALARDRGLL